MLRNVTIKFFSLMLLTDNNNDNYNFPKQIKDWLPRKSSFSKNGLLVESLQELDITIVSYFLGRKQIRQ